MSAGWLIICAGLMSWLGTRYYTAFAARFRILDVPNERSSHHTPTPRGAGVVIVSTFVLGLVAMAVGGWVSWQLCIALLGSGSAVAMAGYLADRDTISVTARILVHAAAAIWGLSWLGGVAPLEIAGSSIHWSWLGNVFGILGLVWLTNLYNFMDGIDGLAASQAFFAALSAAVLLPEVRWPTLLLAAVSLGFLPLNWAPARVFMGDVGSCFLGMVIGLLALSGQAEGVFSPWVWMILLGVFIVDTGVTLFRRVMRRVSWCQAHRQHAYQHASRLFGSHQAVCWAVMGINVFYLLPLAWAAREFEAWAVAIAVFCYIPLMFVAAKLGAGSEELPSKVREFGDKSALNERP